MNLFTIKMLIIEIRDSVSFVEYLLDLNYNKTDGEIIRMSLTLLAESGVNCNCIYVTKNIDTISIAISKNRLTRELGGVYGIKIQISDGLGFRDYIV